MSFEDTIAKQFAIMLMVPMKDEYGNLRKSIVHESLEIWANEHRKELLEEIMKVWTVKTIAEQAVKNLDSTLSDTRTWGPGISAREKLSEEVNKKLAMLLAEKELKRMEEAKTI